MKQIAIIGGGIAGLSALHFIKFRYGDSCRVTLYEKDARLGGTIGTDRIGGFISDWGPNGFLDKVPLTLQMVRELGLQSFLDPSDSLSGKRFIYRHGRLNEISASPAAFMRSPLLSVRGRLRIIREPFVKPRQSWDEDESIFDFVTRRIGHEAAEALIDPMVSGIYGGDARQLSLAACFPIMRDMEKQYGSLIKAMIAKKREAKKSGKKSSGGPAGPAGRLTSFTGGLNTLIEEFGKKYGDAIKMSHSVAAISRAGEGYEIAFDGGDRSSVDAVICGAPAFAAAEMVTDLNPALAEILHSIPYTSIAVVCLGYRRENVGHDLDGFGFLIPRSEGKRILGTIWTSSIFAGRSPKGMVLMRTMIGGATDPEAARLSHGALLDIVTGDLHPILHITDAPVYVRMFTYERGIPQFTIGHPERMERMNTILQNYPGLYFTGNAYDGIGLNDCVIRSEKAVTAMASQIGL